MLSLRSSFRATPERLMLMISTSDAKVSFPWSPSTTKRGCRRLSLLKGTPSA